MEWLHHRIGPADLAGTTLVACDAAFLVSGIAFAMLGFVLLPSASDLYGSVLWFLLLVAGNFVLFSVSLIEQRTLPAPVFIAPGSRPRWTAWCVRAALVLILNLGLASLGFILTFDFSFRFLPIHNSPISVSGFIQDGAPARVDIRTGVTTLGANEDGEASEYAIDGELLISAADTHAVLYRSPVSVSFGVDFYGRTPQSIRSFSNSPFARAGFRDYPVERTVFIIVPGHGTDHANIEFRGKVASLAEVGGVLISRTNIVSLMEPMPEARQPVFGLSRWLIQRHDVWFQHWVVNRNDVGSCYINIPFSLLPPVCWIASTFLRRRLVRDLAISRGPSRTNET